MLLGNEEDFSIGLGYELEGTDSELLALDSDAYGRMLQLVLDRNPELSIVATTLRGAHTATINDWGAVCRTRSGVHFGPSMEMVEIFDRVGGGDSFASGFFYGLLTDDNIDRALAYGVAHGALAMTTPGDNSMATITDVKRLMAGGAARVLR